ncbi:hypothetical protein DL93DRAFT_1665673 [Clavulina sp. PMI_390]|nr:hypothetical protein DL93DRAFT_1665673 [Clavulina sp. PMI_390]
MASVINLPVELLSSIFVFACQGLCDFQVRVPSWRDDMHLLKAVVTLSSVNSLWRDVAISLPQLWAIILVAVDDEWMLGRSAASIQLRLERSRAAPLTLIFELGGCPSKHQVDDIWNIIEPHLPRCQHLFFMNLFPRFLRTIFPLRGSFSSLKKLTIYGPQYAEGGLADVGHFFGESQATAAPLLTDLELVGLPCVQGSFEGLSSIEMRLRQLYSPYQALPVVVEAYLQRNRTVETLVILAPTMWSQRDPESPLNMVTLPYLRRLAVQADSWNWPEMIDAPIVQHLVLTTWHYVALITPIKFPLLEHLSIYNTSIDGNDTSLAAFPLFQSVRRLDICECSTISPILRLLIGSAPVHFPILAEVTIYNSGRSIRSRREIMKLISALLLSRPHIIVSCDEGSLVLCPQWRGWKNLPPNYAGRFHQSIESNLPHWVGFSGPECPEDTSGRVNSMASLYEYEAR